MSDHQHCVSRSQLSRHLIRAEWVRGKNDSSNKYTLRPSRSASDPATGWYWLDVLRHAQHFIFIAKAAEFCTRLRSTVCISLSVRIFVSEKRASMVQLTALRTEMTMVNSSPALWCDFPDNAHFLYLTNHPFITWTSCTSAAEWHFLNNRWMQALITLQRVRLGVYLMPVQAEQSRERTWITQLTSPVYERSPCRM